MEPSLIVSIGIFLSFLAVTIIKFGVPTSFSNNFYLLNKIHDGLGYIFTIVLWGMVFTLLPVWMNIPVGEDWEFLKFFSCAGLCFVGAAPRFLEQDSTVHIVSAIVSAIAGLLWILICTNYWYIVLIYALIFMSLMFITKTKNCFTFWAEMIMFFSIYNVMILLN
jgi:hypothetical protein